MMTDMFYYSGGKSWRSHNSNEVVPQLVSMRNKMINIRNELADGRNVKLIIHNIRNGFHKPAQRLDKSIITHDYYKDVVHSDKSIQRPLFIQIIDNCIKRLTDIETDTNVDSYNHKKEVLSYLARQDELNGSRYILNKGYFKLMRTILIYYMNQLLDHEIEWNKAIENILKRFRSKDDVKLIYMISSANNIAINLPTERDKEKYIINLLYNICLGIVTGDFIVESIRISEIQKNTYNSVGDYSDKDSYSYYNANKMVSYYDSLSRWSSSSRLNNLVNMESGDFSSYSIWAAADD